jgi:hypothetical protein
MINRLSLAALVCGLVSTVSANAATVVFADNFNSNTLGYNRVPTGWSVTDGTVDIIGPGFFDLQPGNGYYVDLDGSTGNAGILSTSLALTAGLTYTADFSLAGNLRNAGTESVTVSFGDSQFVYVLPTSQTFTTYSLAFTPTSSGLFSLSFSNAGGDNYGALLDNVSVTAVPEPQSLALLLAGVMVTGAVARRRQLR